LHVKLENAYSRPQNWGFGGGFYPQNGEQYKRDPQKAHPWAETRRMTYRSSKSVHVCGLGLKKGIPKKPKHVFFHEFAQTTHVVAALHGFACVVIPAARLYIPSFIEIRSGVSELQGVKIWPFPLLWLVAFTTACTTVQAVTSRDTCKFRTDITEDQRRPTSSLIRTRLCYNYCKKTLQFKQVCKDDSG